MSNVIEIDASPHVGQRHVVDHRKRFNHIRSHRRFGKSILQYNLLAECALQGFPVAFVMPTAVEYSKRFTEMTHGLSAIIDSVRVSEGVAEVYGGGRIECFGMHRFDSMRGNHYKRVCVDEAAHSPNLEEAWLYVIKPTLADLKGDAYHFSTPNGANYFKQLDEDNRGNPEWSHIHIPVTSELRNPHLDADEIESQRASLPSVVWQQEWLAEYVDLQGARIKREMLRFVDAPTDIQSLHIGVDLAISTKTESDYTACVVVAKVGNGDLVVVDAQRVKQSFYGIIDFIKAMQSRWNANSIVVESVQFQQAVVEALLRDGLPVRGKNPNRDKVTRFIAVEGQIEHGMLKFSRDLKNEFIDELLAFPVGAHDDMIDALVYAWEGHKQGFKVYL